MSILRLLTFSSLYPNAARPTHGIFVENRLRHLVASGEATSTVLAPVPWFPSGSRGFGAWSLHAAAPPEEYRHGLRVLHPRYLHIPKLGMSLAPWLMYRAMCPLVHELLTAGARFDALDAHYLYPDGVAAVWLGRRYGLPVVMTARGTDVSLIPQYRVPRRLIQDAIAGADAVVTVSAALRKALLALGAPPQKVTVLRNGVDTSLFSPPVNRDATRASFGLRGPTLVSVGLLIERKGHHRTIEALRLLPEFTLLIAGEGPERARLTALVERLGLSARVRLLGALPHDTLPSLYGAADASVLASSREGWANVLLESMACGTPVVASDIWGNPEVVQGRAAGLVASENSADGLAATVRQLFNPLPDRHATRAYAMRFDWDETTTGQLSLFRSVTKPRHRTRHTSPVT